ncbi:MAG: DUF5615 family PIN-like protein [Bryobacteraceae bacterium]
MTLFADEGVDRQIVERLREDGHAIQYVAELERGISDELVLSSSREMSAVLITADKDFGELVFRRGLTNTGVLLVRLAGLTSATKAAIVSDAVRDHGNELACAFSVLSAGGMRIRRSLPT